MIRFIALERKIENQKGCAYVKVLCKVVIIFIRRQKKYVYMHTLLVSCCCCDKVTQIL